MMQIQSNYLQRHLPEISLETNSFAAKIINGFLRPFLWPNTFTWTWDESSQLVKSRHVLFMGRGYWGCVT